jgi:hypothetical protein
VTQAIVGFWVMVPERGRNQLAGGWPDRQLGRDSTLTNTFT